MDMFVGVLLRNDWKVDGPKYRILLKAYTGDDKND